MKELKYLGMMQLTRQDNGKIEAINIFIDSENNPYCTLDGNKIINFEELEKIYEREKPIKDLVEDYIKEQSKKEMDIGEKEREPEDEKNIKDGIEDIKNKGEEKIEEDEKEIESVPMGTEKPKRKPTHVIETIKPDQAKMDYWDSVRKAFGLPSQVKTLAFAYPISTEDKVNYSNITIYMLDNDGNIIDDLDVNDYFEFDSSTGINPMNDNTKRFEEDENKGKVDTKSNDTMVRLKAKNASDSNSYISIEQVNGLDDYHDINAGRKYLVGSQNIEKQLETDHVMVYNSNTERYVNLRDGGKYKLNDIYNEAEDKGKNQDYIGTEQADGVVDEPDSYIPNTEITWKQLSEALGDNDIKKLQEEFFKNYNGSNQNEIINDIKERYERTEKGQEEEDMGRYREGPWDSVKH